MLRRINILWARKNVIYVTKILWKSADTIKIGRFIALWNNNYFSPFQYLHYFRFSIILLPSITISMWKLWWNILLSITISLVSISISFNEIVREKNLITISLFFYNFIAFYYDLYVKIVIEYFTFYHDFITFCHDFI